MERFAIKIDEDAPLNLFEMCRLCGTINTGRLPILQNNVFYMEDGDPELWRKILACVGIQVSKDDKMPQNICTLCHDKILDFYEFREMCLSINLQTRQMLGLPIIETKKIEDYLPEMNKKEKKKPQKRKTEQKYNSKQSKLMKIENDLVFGNSVGLKKTVKNQTLGNAVLDGNGNTTAKKRRSLGVASTTIKDNKIKKQVVDVKYERRYDLNDTKTTQKCDICGEIINSIQFNEHLTSVHVPRVVPYHCIRCNETIMKKSDIKNHNLWHKLSKTPFLCGRCNRKFLSLVGYTRHINDCLTFEKKYIIETKKCLVCQKDFETQNLYDWHSCVTSKLKCPKCNRKFTTPGNTLKHIIRCNAKSVNRQQANIKKEINIDKAFTENNACVLIPSSSTTTISSSSSSSLSSQSNVSNDILSVNDKNKKGKKLTKKDMQRFDDLLKNTYETLQSIKQEPKDNVEITNNCDVTKIDANKEDEQNTYDNNDDIHNDNNDYYSSDNDDDLQGSVNVKQEVIDIHDTQFEKDIISDTNNIKLPEETNTEKQQQEQQQQQPTIKLKIKKEHGTLNSLLIGENVDSNCEDLNSKKKKRKKKKSNDKDTSETMENIKQEPIDDDEFDNVNENGNEEKISQNQNCDNPSLSNDNSSNITGTTDISLPIISAVSSLANESIQDSDTTLPVISSVHSAVEIPNTLDIPSRIVIKQEIPDEFENHLPIIKQEKDDESLNATTSTAEKEIIVPKLIEINTINDTNKNNLSCSDSNSNHNNKRSENNLTDNDQILEQMTSNENNAIQNTLINNMEMVQIKKEIDYEDYANQPVSNDEYNEHIGFMSNTIVKEEFQLNYGDTISDEIYNESNENMTTNLELNNQYDMFDSRIVENIKKEKNDEINLNSCSASDTVFQFKKIVLKSSTNNELNKENCPEKLEQDNANDITNENNLVNQLPEEQSNENLENPEETEVTQSHTENDDNVIMKSNNDCDSEEQISKQNDEHNEGNNDLVLDQEDCNGEKINLDNNELKMTENDSENVELEKMKENRSIDVDLCSADNEILMNENNDKIPSSSLEMENSDEKNNMVQTEIQEIKITSVLCGTQVDELLKMKNVSMEGIEKNENLELEKENLQISIKVEKDVDTQEQNELNTQKCDNDLVSNCPEDMTSTTSQPFEINNSDRMENVESSDMNVEIQETIENKVDNNPEEVMEVESECGNGNLQQIETKIGTVEDDSNNVKENENQSEVIDSSCIENTNENDINNETVNNEFEKSEMNETNVITTTSTITPSNNTDNNCDLNIIISNEENLQNDNHETNTTTISLPLSLSSVSLNEHINEIAENNNNENIEIELRNNAESKKDDN